VTRVTQTIEPANEQLLTWIHGWADLARDIGDALVVPLPGPVVEVDSLARLWDSWLTRGLEGVDPNGVINAVGYAFGSYLVQRVGMSWALVTDEYGTEVAVHGSPGDLLIFPANFVAKRYETRERLPLHEAADRAAELLRQAREGTGPWPGGATE